MRVGMILFLLIFSLFYCQLPLNEFKEQFILEINKFKPKYDDKILEKNINKFAKTYLVQSSYTNKVVELNHIFNTCHLDFEINLVKSDVLPASNHLIAHIIVGGLIIPGQEQKPIKNDLWAANVGVVLENDLNTVYSLIYDLKVHFDKKSFVEKSGLDLDNISEETLVNSIFYNKCLEIAENEMSLIGILPENEFEEEKP